MMTALVVSNVLLWLLVIGLALTVYALTRQIGVLYERVAPAGALMVNQTLAVGDAAPSVAATTLTGNTLALGEPLSPGRGQLLFFLAPDCPICKSLLPVLRSMQGSSDIDVDIVLASDGDEIDEHRRYVEAQQISDFPYVLSEALGRAYGVSKLPYAVLVRADGRISSLGIVNSREHLESLFEAEALNVASLQDYLAGQQVPEIIDATATQKANPGSATQESTS